MNKTHKIHKLSYEVWVLIRQFIPASYDLKPGARFGYQSRQELCYKIAEEILRSRK